MSIRHFVLRGGGYNPLKTIYRVQRTCPRVRATRAKVAVLSDEHHFCSVIELTMSFICTNCRQPFSRKSDLNRNFKKPVNCEAYTVPDVIYTCQFVDCNREFRANSVAKRHEKICQKNPAVGSKSYQRTRYNKVKRFLNSIKCIICIIIDLI